MRGPGEGKPVKKPKAGTARPAGKRQAKRNRRAKAQGAVPLRLDLEAADYVIASWLATKPTSERWGLLERYASVAGILEAIRQDTASHEAMLELLAREPAPGFVPA